MFIVYLLLSPVAKMLRQMALIEPRQFNHSLAHLEEDPLDRAALHASLLLDHRVEQLSRGDPLDERKRRHDGGDRFTACVVICNMYLYRPARNPDQLPSKYDLRVHYFSLKK